MGDSWYDPWGPVQAVRLAVSCCAFFIHDSLVFNREKDARFEACWFVCGSDGTCLVGLIGCGCLARHQPC